MRLRIVLGVVTLEMIGAAACSTSSTKSGPYTGPRTMTCSNGAPRDEPPEYGSSALTGLPSCIPRCGETKIGGDTGEARYSIAALPSGACENDGEACAMGAGSVTTCPGRSPRVCDLTAFECRCANGAWQCITTAQGGGICPCNADEAAQGDASAD